MDIILILKQFGLSEKEVKIYLTLLKLGSQPVRIIAQEARINRGTTYDILKSLMDLGLVSYYHKEKHQYFVAEDPEKLEAALEEKKRTLDKLKNKILKIIPELKSIYEKEEKPVVKYYEGLKGVKTILQDVIDTVKKSSKKEYFVYSSADIRKFLYKAYPSFTKDRVSQEIKVKVIALGSGGELMGLDERKWLTHEESAPTYILIYAYKIALISVNSNLEPLGVIIEDEGLAQTQKLLFEWIWEKI